jgi:hypothetical protein
MRASLARSATPSRTPPTTCKYSVTIWIHFLVILISFSSETVQGATATASKEANKEQAKGHGADSSLSGRVSGALGAAGDKVDEKKHETSARANKEGI